MRDYVNLARIEELVESRHISKRKHPRADLFIYNYTPKTQYGGPWTNETMRCRGLILDGAGGIVSLPFPKFFNLNELVPGRGRIGIGAPVREVTEKLDGRLLVSYHLGAEVHLASRGAFVSDEALYGTRLLRERHDMRELDPDLTLLFELIAPRFRVVVSYSRSELVLIGARDRVSGADLLHADLVELGAKFGFPVVAAHAPRDPEEFVRLAHELPVEREGFVLRLADGERLKIKGDAYRRLASLVEGLSPKRILEELLAGTYDELLELLPEPFRSEAAGWGEDYRALVARRLARVHAVLALLPPLGDSDRRARRKAVYLHAREHLGEQDAFVLMSLFDGRDPRPVIYRELLLKSGITKGRVD